jgi:hypothetical protein
MRESGDPAKMLFPLDSRFRGDDEDGLFPDSAGVFQQLVHQSKRRRQPEFGKIDAKAKT